MIYQLQGMNLRSEAFGNVRKLSIHIKSVPRETIASTTKLSCIANESPNLSESIKPPSPSLPPPPPSPVIKLDLPRFIAYNLLAVAIALAANVSGITSLLLSFNGEYFREKKLDEFYPINHYMRKIDHDDRYEYLIPDSWLPDQAIALAEVREREIPEALRAKRPMKTRPDSAYGPRGKGVSTRGRLENMSVIKSTVLPGFSLRETLGPPPRGRTDNFEINVCHRSSSSCYKPRNKHFECIRRNEI